MTLRCEGAIRLQGNTYCLVLLALAVYDIMAMLHGIIRRPVTVAWHDAFRFLALVRLYESRV